MIPKYRAKRLDSDEYVEGFLTYEVHERHKKYFITRPPTKINEVFTSYDRVDPSTLSINFPDMLDKNNKPIFASLSEDGEGGDYHEEYGCKYVARYTNRTLRYSHSGIEVTGIYKGVEDESKNNHS